MNVNSTNNSPCIVVSKYFSSSPVMDESLSDFKEKKEACKGPKKTQKPTVNKIKQKRLPKCIKGQKDIRFALKKNEQLTYAKEFDDICKKVGVDIDSEQLQLAVALSKSLQTSEDNESSSSKKPLSSQERTKKIRATLQEYGFAVPEIKVASKKIKKRKKNYKLLTLTDADKQQIISDKYAQVLFDNASSSMFVNNQDIDYSQNKCYFVATNITYMILRNNSTLYVEDLVDRSSTKGSLLRDWASIPGRPISPVKKEQLNMNISEIECSQEELDLVLSGTLKSAKDVVKTKVDSKPKSIPTIVIDVDKNADSDLPKSNEEKNDKTIVNQDSVHTKSIDVSKDITLSVSDRIRSCSPDIFDDEESIILYSNNDTNNKLEISKTNDVVMDLTEYENDTENNDDIQLSQNRVLVAERNSIVRGLTQTQNINRKSVNQLSQNSQISNFTTKNSIDFMEITECVGIKSPTFRSKNDKTFERDSKLFQSTKKVTRSSDEILEVILSCSQSNSNKNNLHATLSQEADITKRKSNDLMEITECVTASSSIPVNIDLSQNCDYEKITIAREVVHNNVTEKVDLSQSSTSEDELHIVQMSQSNKSLDDTIILNDDELLVNNPIKLSAMSNMNPIATENTLDLTDSPPDHIRTDSKQTPNQSFFHDYVHNHSDDTTKETIEKSSCNDDFLPKETNENDAVDLTQSSNSSRASEQQNNCSIQTSKSSLGKKHDVSIDYDEMFDAVANNSTKEDDPEGENETYGLENEDNDDVNERNDAENEPQTSESDNISKNSQLFDISDKEFEYSLNQSSHDLALRVGFGGISVLDADLGVSKSVTCMENKLDAYNTANSISDSFLPVVKVKSNVNANIALEKRNKTPVVFNKEKAVTPFKAFTTDNVDTPTSNEYIVKTDQVTPMLDYASMSTPERNRELNKYGLKPFKRKRAIQLLTHLYNQTHPVVEICQEDLPSPSKRSKPSQTSLEKTESVKKSPKNVLKSPRRLIKSPRQLLKSSKVENIHDGIIDNNVYEVTDEVPEIRDIECSEEDWVFQKREKAKLHSCRVPLHIAFHNYVSCRRKLRETILRYEPVNIDVIHKDLVASGHRYDPKDLLKYLDKKCITVKTADNNARKNKR